MPKSYAKSNASKVSTPKKAVAPRDYSSSSSSARGKKLIIVESPAKCKKIEEFLGKDEYKCVASYGHLRELSSLKNIDFDNDFAPTFTIIDDPMKKQQVERLRADILAASEVILSSDKDREGEMIAYSILDLFALPLTTKRIVFNEITRPALQQAIAHPTVIDMNVVNAAKARQILDLIVGYKVSPVLWQCIASSSKTNALSAGRCQTPALRLVYDNQLEMDRAKVKTVYTVAGIFTTKNISFDLNHEFEEEDTTTDFLDASITHVHKYSCAPPQKVTRKQPSPMTTSRLQQLASNELKYSPKDTMRLAQTLYEGGYITYMRTDSVFYSEEFLETVKVFVVAKYTDPRYLLPSIDELTSEGAAAAAATKPTKRSKKSREEEEKPKAQEAHEAIRPTKIEVEELPETMGPKERRLYALIWKTALQSCMAPAIYQSITATISSPKESVVYTKGSEEVDFPGWQIVENKPPYHGAHHGEYYTFFRSIKQDSVIKYKKITAKVALRGTKQHYTEAKLVQWLEDKGIGRPSTFSSLVDKIQERGYVKKEDVPGREVECRDFELTEGSTEILMEETKRTFGAEHNKLVLQPLGKIVMEFLGEHFDALFRYAFTSEMEGALDQIAKGEAHWVDLCRRCNEEVEGLLGNVSDIKKLQLQIDEEHQYMVGKHGPVIKSTRVVDGKEVVQFQAIRPGVDVYEMIKEGKSIQLEDIVDEESRSSRLLGQYEGKDVVLRMGKFGLFVTWGEEKRSLKDLEDRDTKSIAMEDVLPFLTAPSAVVRVISKVCSVRQGKFGDYLFYMKPGMKKPKFMDIKAFQGDYKVCSLEELTAWIHTTHKIKV